MKIQQSHHLWPAQIAGLVLVCLAIVVAILAIALHIIPAIAPQTTYQVGQAVNAGSWQVTVQSAKTNAGSPGNAPAAGDVFVVFAIRATNSGAQTLPLSSEDSWTLQGANGTQYREAVDLAAGPTLDVASVLSGATISGAIAYEVPKSVRDVTLSFQPDLNENTLYTWDITLS